MKQLIQTAAVFAATFSALPALAAEQAAFSPGEQAVYQIEYLGMNAGMAQIDVGAPMQQWGRAVWPITTSAKSSRKLFFFPIRDRFITYWDFDAHRSIGSDLYADENRKRRTQRIQLDHEAQSAKVVKQKEGEDRAETVHQVAAGTTDIASATFALRNQDLTVGKSFDLPVFTGVKSFTLRSKVISREKLDTPLGPKDTFKVRAQTDFSGKLKSKRDVFVWLTTDPSHVPVRIEAEFVLGSIVAELTQYNAGQLAAVSSKVGPGVAAGMASAVNDDGS